jgi:aminocarboxymuconate-semialdehyde decarboxylase
MVLANIDGRPLTDPAFAPIWNAIDSMSLPVLVHPTAPLGVSDMDMVRFQLTASLGFTFDTSLAIARMI